MQNIKNFPRNTAKETSVSTDESLLRGTFFMEEENWRPVEGFSDYKVSNLSRISSVDRYTTYKDTKYMQVSLYKNETRYTVSLHVIVAKAFVENPENKPTLNHKDGNKLNNAINNLEWATFSEQAKHKFDVLGHKPNSHNQIQIVQTDLGFKEISRHFSIRAAGRSIGVNMRSIQGAMKFKKPFRGFYWLSSDDYQKLQNK